MNVLVIGGTGFISSRLVHFLLRTGYEVTTVTRGRSPADDLEGVERLHADRDDTDRMRKLLDGRRFEAVYDMVAYTPDQSRTAAEILEGSVERFIHCSTISVYMVSDRVRCPITEDQDKLPLMDHWPRNPFGMDYGIMKRRCEDVLWQAHEEGRLRVSMLRPPYVCGPHDPMIRDFFWIERILDGRPLVVPGSGDFAFQNVFVDDVARAFVDLLSHPDTAGSVYNVASEEIMTLNLYLERLARLLKRSLEIVHIPQAVFDRQPFSSNPRGDVFPFNTRTTAVFSIEAIRSDLSYQSTLFEDWMQATIDWYATQFDGHSLGYDLRTREVAFALDWKRQEQALRERFT